MRKFLTLCFIFVWTALIPVQQVHALSPEQRALLFGSGPNYTNPAYPTFSSSVLMTSTQLSDFRNTGSTNDAQMVTDPTNPYGFAQSVQIGGTFGSTTTYRLVNVANRAPIDITNGQIVIQYKPISDTGPTNHWGQFEPRVFSAGTPAAPGSNYMNTTALTAPMAQISSGINGSTANGRWQSFSFHTSQLAAVGTGADLTQVIRFELQYKGTAGFAPAIFIANVLFVPTVRPRGALILAFEDGRADAYTIAKPIMDTATPSPVPGVNYLSTWEYNTSLRDGTTYLSNAQLASLLASNWQIGSQAWSTEDVTIIDAMTSAQRQNECISMRRFAVQNGDPVGGQDGSNFSNVYWSGNDYIARPDFMPYFRTGRTYLFGAAVNPYVLRFAETFPFGDRYNIRGVGASVTGYATPTAGFSALIDGAVATKGVAVLIFHTELSAGGGGFTAADYQTGLQDIITRYNANPGQFDILTTKQLLSPYLNFLLKRDVDPASNDNDPMWLSKAA